MTDFNISWQMVDAAVNLLAQRARTQEFEVVVGIARGGLIPATMLSHRLNLPLEVISVKSYDNARTPLRHPQIIIDGRVRDLLECILNRKVLFIDDIIDSGRTQQVISNMYGSAQFMAIVSKNPPIPILGHYHVINVQPDTWVKFPWEIC